MVGGAVLSREDVMSRMEEAGLIAVIRLHSADRVEPALIALSSAGVRVMEITMTVPGATGLISRARRELPDACTLGAGTVTDAQMARGAIQAGAEFIVSPLLEERVVAAARESCVAVIPGVMTPTEARRALDAGADAIKLFPARSLGPEYVRDLLGPLPGLKIIPAGGVGLDNAAAYIHAGCPAVFSGSSLVNDRLAREDGLGELQATARRMVSVINKAKGGSRA